MNLPYLQPTAKYSSRGYAANEKVSGPIDYDYCELLVSRIEEAQASLLNDYDDYLHCTFALANLGERGRELMHRVARLSPKYDTNDCNRKFDNCLSKGDGRISLATFVKMAKDASIDTSRPRSKKAKTGNYGKSSKPTVEQIHEELNKYAQFRKNTMTDKIEVKFDSCIGNDIECDKWMNLDDRSLNDLFTVINKDGIYVTVNKLASLIDSNFMSTMYDPGKEWLDSLPAWDESQPDHIGELLRLFHFSDESKRPFYEKYMRRFIITHTALMYGIVDDNQLVPILVGGENIGKTYFCQTFLPPELTRYIRIIPKDTPLEKDLLISLSEFYLIVIDEANLTGKNFGVFKTLVSIKKTNERAAYDRFKKERKRRTSFIGTTNEEHFLDELDGARRILSVNVCEIDFIDPDTINYKGIYAQALYYAKQKGYRFRLNAAEVRELNENNQDHVQEDPITESILLNFRIPNKDEVGELFTATEIYNVIQYSLPTKEKNTIAQIGKKMRQMQFKAKTLNGKSMYRLHRIMQDEQKGRSNMELCGIIKQENTAMEQG